MRAGNPRRDAGWRNMNQVAPAANARIINPILKMLALPAIHSTLAKANQETSTTAAETLQLNWSFQADLLLACHPIPPITVGIRPTRKDTIPTMSDAKATEILLMRFGLPRRFVAVSWSR
jgi:hypothetical protein